MIEFQEGYHAYYVYSLTKQKQFVQVYNKFKEKAKSA
jgi:hypothetical protein